MREKIRFMTELLRERFGESPLSHKAGRLGFDGRYAAMLLEHGYRVDCSVAPGIDWSGKRGAPGGGGGPDYRGVPERAYLLRPGDDARSEGRRGGEREGVQNDRMKRPR